jgi:hypothetical protein
MELRKPTVHGRYIRMLLYGANRVGKSVFAGSAVEVYPTLFLEIDEGGSDSLVRFGYEPDVLRVTGVKDLNEVFWELKSGDWAGRYGVVVFDGMTELAKRAMDTVLGVGPSAEGQNFLSSDKMPGRREWGVTTEQMRKVVRYFTDLPLHIIWVAQERTFTDPATGAAVRIGPALNPALADDLANYSKLICYMMAREDKGSGALRRYLVMSPFELNGVPVVAGHRMGLKDEVRYLVDPVFKDIHNLVLLEREEEAQKAPLKKKQLVRAAP